MNYDNNIILVVDDNVNNIKMIVDYLKESGFETAVARNGTIGLTRAELLHPALILMDVMMPEMDGFETCRKLKADDATKDIPIIFMTALDGPDDKIKAFECGGVDYIAKPAQQEEVLARVKTHISLRGAQKKLLEQNTRLQQEITKRKETEDRIKAALAEKEVLLKEVHHRVKNNLQVLIHLIDMQAETVSNQEVIKAFEDFQGRIRAMAVVHENLYQSDDLSQIDFGDYIKALATAQFQAIKGDSPISLLVDADDAKLAVNLAIPCGLMISELIINALKYAFPRERLQKSDCKIRVEFRLKNGEYILKTSDNGVGLPQELDWRKTESLGLKLVNIWATYQLEGEIELDTSNGTSFTVKFSV